jgi:hypothetical protein
MRLTLEFDSRLVPNEGDTYMRMDEGGYWHMQYDNQNLCFKPSGITRDKTKTCFLYFTIARTLDMRDET